MGSEHRYAAAFHAQQCAEKAAKAFLVHNNVRPPRTHDIEELAIAIQPLNVQMAKKLKAIKSLTRFAVIYRYPDAERKAVSLSTIKTAIKNTQKFYDFAAELILK